MLRPTAGPIKNESGPILSLIYFGVMKLITPTGNGCPACQNSCQKTLADDIIKVSQDSGKTDQQPATTKDQLFKIENRI